MKTIALFLGLSILVSGAGTQEKITLGKKAADFTLRTLDGKDKSFAEISKGKITVVDFWSVNCPISKGWEERLAAIHNDYTKKGIKFLIVNSNSTEPVDAIREYLTKNKLSYEVFVDPKSMVADLFAAKTTPHIYVFDAEGVLAYVGAIDDDAKGSKKAEERKNHLRNALDEILSDKKVTVPSTDPVGCTIKRPKA